MKKLGKTQPLEILRFTSVGAYLNDIDETSDSDVLLPKKYLSDEMALGDMVDVFLYKDAENRLIATTQQPDLEVGAIGALTVAAVTDYGAFLKWGLDKDLFLPNAEQKQTVAVGQTIAVIVYIDKSERLCASQKIEKYLTTVHQYAVDQWVTGTVYAVSPQIGAFIAVANKHFALLPAKDLFISLKIGQSVEARIAKIHPDGKLVLSLRADRAEQIQIDVAMIIDKLIKNDGVLPFDDKASPDAIKAHLQMSKKAFKRAIGVLLKQNRIIMEKGVVTLKDKQRRGDL